VADRSIVIRVGANVTGLVAGLQTGKQAMSDFTGRTLDGVQRNSAAISTLSRGVGVAGLAMTAMAAAAVKSFADFDQSMSYVQAATHESAENMDLLRDAALEAGKRTVYSATESASAIEELAKAGISTTDILAGGLDGALDLAAAGGLDVAEAAGIAAVALKQFNLDGKQMSHVSDLMAAGAGKAMGDVGDLGMALRQAGQVANSTGLSIEETTAGLAAFAAAGLIGSDAGTSFKSMLQRLTPQSAQAQAEMDRLGISAYDASGNFIGLADFAGNLQDALRDLTPQQRNAAEATIFGSDAVRAANVLYEQGEQGIRDWTEAVSDQGYASETAAIRLDNLKGDLEQLSGSVETAMIGMGEGANGPLRSMTQGVTNLVNAFADTPDAVQGVTLALVGGGGLVALGAAGLGKLVILIKDAKVALEALKISGRTAGIAVGGIGAALTVASLGLMAWASRAAEASARTQEFQDTLDEFGDVTNDTLTKINIAIANNPSEGILDNLMGSHTDSMIEDAKKIGIAVEDLQGYILDEADAIDRVAEAGLHYNNVNDSMLGTSLIDRLNEQRSALTEAEKAQGRKAEANAVAGISEDEVASAYGATAAAISGTTTALDDWLKMVGDSDQAFVDLGGAYQSIVDANTVVAQSAADATGDASKSWEDFYDGVSVGVDEYLAELQSQVDAQTNWEANMLILSGRVSQGVLDELARMGPEGAPLVAALATATDEQLAQLEPLVAQRVGDATETFATTLSDASPVIAAAGAQLGQTTADEIARKLQEGSATVESIMWDYKLRIEGVSPRMQLDTTMAYDEMQNFVDAYTNREFTVKFRASVGAMTAAQYSAFATAYGGAHAGGGAIVGPGTSTSDSVLIRASTGEHMWPADEVRMAGGQSGMYRLRSLVRSGVISGFRDGGPVVPGYVAGGEVYSQRQYVYQPEWASVSAAGPSRTVEVTQQITVADPIGAAEAAVRRLVERWA
jgi:TP901 family phage tail tape measure protein